MNAVLRAVLAEAGWGGAEDVHAWRRAIVLNNGGAVPRKPGVGDEYAQKGFKLLLLDKDGRPILFARCADAADALMEQECRILCALSRAPELRWIIPEARTAVSGDLRVLMTKFVSGTTLDHLESRQRPSVWAATVHRVLETAETTGRVARAALPALCYGRQEMVELREEVEPDLASLRDAGLPVLALSILESALKAAPPLPRVLQHGDLWSSNVIIDGSSCWLIDFAEFGHVHVPMYDVCHLLAHSRRADFQISAPRGKNSLATLSQAIVNNRATRNGLSSEQLSGAVLYYVMHLAAYRMRAGVMSEFRTPYVNELLRVAEAIQKTGRVAEWIAPSQAG